MRIFLTFGMIVAVSAIPGFCFSQQNKSFDVQQLLLENRLQPFGKSITPLDDGDRHGISSDGIVWLRGVRFSKGTIEVDLRGKDIPQQSFLGIAFHGVDTSAYDAIYFRPFNFRSTDPTRKIHAVQYISVPAYTWERLRKEDEGQYEKGINPPPPATDWFHARIVVGDRDIKVYVNNASKPCLEVDKLNNRRDGLIGLWNFGLPGDFANLVISQ